MTVEKRFSDWGILFLKGQSGEKAAVRSPGLPLPGAKGASSYQSKHCHPGSDILGGALLMPPQNIKASENKKDHNTNWKCVGIFLISLLSQKHLQCFSNCKRV